MVVVPGKYQRRLPAEVTVTLVRRRRRSSGRRRSAIQAGSMVKVARQTDVVALLFVQDDSSCP
ncbi:hypothetical protein ACIPX0_32600 [Streptomyces sp. NPDC090075]|uniref:hypothetical protein n=1 Tax=Streptomyces sp. NPDC090075 TaxID=3365937 RepID=UPI003809C7C9